MTKEVMSQISGLKQVTHDLQAKRVTPQELADRFDYLVSAGRMSFNPLKTPLESLRDILGKKYYSEGQVSKDAIPEEIEETIRGLIIRRMREGLLSMDTLLFVLKNPEVSMPKKVMEQTLAEISKGIYLNLMVDVINIDTSIPKDDYVQKLKMQQERTAVLSFCSNSHIHVADIEVPKEEATSHGLVFNSSGFWVRGYGRESAREILQWLLNETHEGSILVDISDQLPESECKFLNGLTDIDDRIFVCSFHKIGPCDPVRHGE